MRRYLTLFCLLCLTIPAGISITGCVRNPAGNYCNGLGYGLKDTAVYSIDLEPRTTGISLAFGQTRQIGAPTAKTCKGASASVTSYSYGDTDTNRRFLDVSPTGNMCAGTWNRNSGGGIADYTICNVPSPRPNTNGLPYYTAYISASADSVTSNPVAVYVHAQISSISLALAGTTGTQECSSQDTVAQLNAEACYAGANNTQYEFCAPAGVTNYACPGKLAPGVTSVPDCTAAIGTLSYTVGTSSVATINPETNQITAELPGTTVITASIAGTGSSAGYFSTCPPKSISVTLSNGSTSGTVTQGVQQNLVTTVTDTKDQPITGLTLDYQSTNPLEITAGTGGAISALFPGAASVYAICQPSTCNPAPINQVGIFGTGLSISSNAVDITTPGTASAYMWFSAPGKSQYVIPISLLNGTPASTVRLPYVPNSMLMDQTGANLYFGSAHELMIYSTTSNTVTKEDPNAPGVVLAVAPNNQSLLINDPVRQVLYIYSPSGTATTTFGGLASAAAWTPDSKTLYVTDSAALGGNHTDTLYVYNANTGWTTYPLAASDADNPVTNPGAQNVAVLVPGIGAFLSGAKTVAHTWCPTGKIGDYASMSFYPEPPNDSVATLTDVLAATKDGQHIVGAAYASGVATLSDISLQIPNGQCPPADSSGALKALTVPFALNPPETLDISATAVDQVVTSSAAVSQGTSASPYDLSFVTYTGSTPNAKLPYYKETTTPAAPGTFAPPGTLGYVTLATQPNGPAPTAPLAGAFSPDNAFFFVSTSGDNMIHYIDTTKLTDTQQISPNLPACTPGSDPDCVLTNGSLPASGIVPATAVAVKPRSTT